MRNEELFLKGNSYKGSKIRSQVYLMGTLQPSLGSNRPDKANSVGKIDKGSIISGVE